MTADAAFDDADFNGFVDGRLEAGRAAALAEALASDPEARARLDAWRHHNEGLRAMFAAVLAEPVPLRLVSTTSARGRERPAPDRPGRGGRTAGAVASVAVGAALAGFAFGVLASLGSDGFGLRPGGAGRPALGAEARDLAGRAAEAHRTFLAGPARPAEAGSGDRPPRARWLRGRVGPAARAPDLAGQGWSFLSGRTVPGRAGPAAFLVYGSGADRLGLLVAPGENGDGRVSAAAEPGPPLAVATFGDAGLGYALTADRGPDWLGRNVGPLRADIEGQARAAPP